DKIIFLSPPYKEFVLNNYIRLKEINIIKEKAVVIPFGIDNFWFENMLSEKKKLNKNEIRLLFVGKINENKNINTIIEVCNYLIQQGYKIRFTVVGIIEDKKIGEQLNCYDFVNFIGYADKEHLR